jgi:hypothetical protein
MSGGLAGADLGGRGRRRSWSPAGSAAGRRGRTSRPPLPTRRGNMVTSAPGDRAVPLGGDGRRPAAPEPHPGRRRRVLRRQPAHRQQALGPAAPGHRPGARGCVPDPREILGNGSALADGTVAPTWDWTAIPDLYSGKAGYAGMNIQVAADLDGRIAAIGPVPVHGARHDAHARRRLTYKRLIRQRVGRCCLA